MRCFVACYYGGIMRTAGSSPLGLMLERKTCQKQLPGQMTDSTGLFRTEEVARAQRWRKIGLNSSQCALAFKHLSPKDITRDMECNRVVAAQCSLSALPLCPWAPQVFFFFFLFTYMVYLFQRSPGNGIQRGSC